MQFIQELANDSNEAEMLEFLKKNENFSMYLLGNIELYGRTVQESPYSGNYRIIRNANGKIVTVFYLSRKGTLLITSDIVEPIFALVEESCREEPFILNGVVGKGDFCIPYWNYLKSTGIVKSETFREKYVLYSLSLDSLNFATQKSVRSLIESDYDQWIKLRMVYLAEEGLPNDLTDDQRHKVYLDKVQRSVNWGLFLNNELISIADLTSRTATLGQVGGVYTVPQHRRKGYSRAVMHHVIHACKERLSINKLIIYTAESNWGAQGLYKSLGCIEEGFYTLFFGTTH